MPGASFLREGASSEHLYTVLQRLGLSLQDARRRPPADSQLRAAGRHGRPARHADARDGAFGRGAHAAGAVRVSARKLWDLYSQLSVAGFRHHLARRARGAADRRASGQPRPAHRARAHRVSAAASVRARRGGRAGQERHASSFRSPSSISPTRSACRWCTPTRRSSGCCVSKAIRWKDRVFEMVDRRRSAGDRRRRRRHARLTTAVYLKWRRYDALRYRQRMAAAIAQPVSNMSAPRSRAPAARPAAIRPR